MKPGGELHNKPISRRSQLHLTRSTEASEAEWRDDRIASSSGGVTELTRLYRWKRVRIAEGSVSRMCIIGLRSLYTVDYWTLHLARTLKKTAEKVSINLATSRNKKRNNLGKVDSSWSITRPTVMVQPSQYPAQRLYKTSTDLTCRTGPAKWISLIGPTFKGCSCRRDDPQKQTKRNQSCVWMLRGRHERRRKWRQQKTDCKFSLEL